MIGQTTVTRGASRIPELDGLRGIAILSVVFLHYFYTFAPVQTGPVHWISRIFALGWTGVDLFFVLSGFLIGGILMDQRGSPSYFKTFYLRRAFRILPIYYLWIVLFIGFLLIAGPYLRLHTRSGQLPRLNLYIYEHFLFLQNMLAVKYTTFAAWWFQPTWSLAVEEQFYLVAPLLVRYVPRRLLPRALGAVVVAAPILRLLIRLHSGADPNTPEYRLMPCRADSLAIGMLVAYAWRSKTIREGIIDKPARVYSLFVVLSAAMVLIWWRYPNPNDPITQSIGYSVVAWFYAVLLVVAIGFPQGLIARCTRWGVLREFGRISYCLYLIHFVVGFFCFGFLMRDIVHFSDLRSGLVGLLSFAVSYGVSLVSWTYFEHPLLKIGHHYKY